MVSLRKRKANFNYSQPDADNLKAEGIGSFEEDDYENDDDDYNYQQDEEPSYDEDEEFVMEEDTGDDDGSIENVEELDDLSESSRGARISNLPLNRIKVKPLRKASSFKRNRKVEITLSEPTDNLPSDRESNNSEEFYSYLGGLINQALLNLLQRDETGRLRFPKKKTDKSSKAVLKRDDVFLWHLEMQEVEEGRFKCPLRTCSKAFKTLPSIKYHLQTFRHSLTDFVMWAFYGEGASVCQQGIENLPETVQDFVSKAPSIPSINVLSSDFIYYSYPGVDLVQENQIMFDTKSFSAKSLNMIPKNENIFSTTSTSSQIEEENSLINWINLAIACILVETDEKPTLKSDVTNSLPFALDKVLPMVKGSAENSSSDIDRCKCPLPGCSKFFKVQPSFKYHVTHFNHDLLSFLKHTYFGPMRESIDNFAKSNNIALEFSGNEAELEQQLSKLQMASTTDIISDSFLYRWPGINHVYDCAFQFELPQKTAKVPVPKSRSSNVGSGSSSRIEVYTTKEAHEMPYLCPPLIKNHLDSDSDKELFSNICDIDSTILSIEEGQAHLPRNRQWNIMHILGKDNVKLYELSAGQCERLPKEIQRNGYLMNSGGSVFATEWCPRIPKGKDSYIAVGGSNESSMDFVVGSRTLSMKGCIQFWRIPSESLNERSLRGISSPLPSLHLVICHEYGAVFDLKWCPMGCYSETSNRLGVLAATFHDGSMRMFSIPIVSECSSATFVKLNPFFSWRISEGTFTRLSWNIIDDHVYLAGGSTNGEVYLFDMQKLEDYSGKENVHEPIFYKKEHQFLCRSIAWPDGDNFKGMFLTSGYDGRLNLFNINGDENYVDCLRKHNGFLSECLWQSSIDGMLYASSDHTVRYIPEYDRAKSSVCIVHKSGIWCLDHSKYHTFIASSSSDGTVQICNVLRNRARDSKNLQVPLYRLDYDYSAGNTLVMGENEKILEAVYKKSEMQVSPLETIIYSVRWHPSPYASTWIVSGGRSGVVRLDCTYVNDNGSKPKGR